ncbi:TPA: phage antirepressor KilAC domain-containing protein [Streptococcus agalactiae]|uniref:phage antirepressor KilAC domain-containing protein n=1 Tax=Streptococcus agalactiae TaxID=1311 RepID=UPI0005A6063C|nr:phage antirepressor KilAC domain-containing protein [Streptococcus agalactiae]KLK31756.1 oxidoreductase [Streptococcus agalactiae]HEN7302797.1 phage antirepressor KilAC domain-containing protein [Streptococcus agalactiae]
MDELISITLNENHEPVVSARDLHRGLEVKSKYNDWLKRMLDYGFSEGTDFIAIAQKKVTAQGNQSEYVEHIFNLDSAKEIAMIQRNDKGKEVRKYFIQVEKDFNSPEKIMARALLMADKKVHRLEAQIEADRPKVLFADAVSASHTSILVGELAKLLKQNGVNIGATRLFTWLRKHGYLIKRNGRDWNMPTQKSVELGLIRVKETSITHSDGHITVSKTPLVTGKGQQYFINKFLNKEYLPV